MSAKSRLDKVGRQLGEGQFVDTVWVYLHAEEWPREIEPPRGQAAAKGVWTMGIPPDRSGDWPRGELIIVGDDRAAPAYEPKERWDFAQGEDPPTREEWEGWYGIPSKEQQDAARTRVLALMTPGQRRIVEKARMIVIHS